MYLWRVLVTSLGTLPSTNIIVGTISVRVVLKYALAISLQLLAKKALMVN